VIVHDAFTSRNFGDSSLVFVTDYHPLQGLWRNITLAQELVIRVALPGSCLEQVLWSYVVQIAGALKTIHGSELAAK
jgi:PAB-dependent poly(A)-specific ribonuclease subunit 3